MSPYLTIGLKKTPQVLARIVRHVPESGWDTRSDPERFTLREMVAHLADWEPIFRARMQLALESPGARVEVYDEGSRATERDYAAQDVEANLDLFASERAQTVALLQKLSASDFERRVTHPEVGELSLADLGTMLLGHDVYHLDQAAERL